MNRHQSIVSEQPVHFYHYPTLNQSQQNPPSILNKIAVDPETHSLFCAYSNGRVLRYDTLTRSLCHTYPIYDNTDILDIQLMGSNLLLTSTHDELTLYDLVKHKSLALKGHEESPVAVSSHPISPLVVSVSNLLVQHDLRIRKPINVNFITPPVYDVEYFSDGSYYFLSGEPCRIGRDIWVRTLLNGIGTPSDSSKYILANEMNGSLVMWDWRKSARVLIINNVENHETYQHIFFKKCHGDTRGIVFLQDDGKLLEYNILTNALTRRSILQGLQNDNWKLYVGPEETTKEIYLYEHLKAEVKCFNVSVNQQIDSIHE